MVNCFTWNDFIFSIGRLRTKDDIEGQRNKINELMQFNKMKYGENIALKKNQRLMEEDQKHVIQQIPKLIKFKEQEAEARGKARGIEHEKKQSFEKRSKSAKKGAETKARRKKEKLQKQKEQEEQEEEEQKEN